MRRRALLATALTVPLAGCPTPPWGKIPETAGGAEVTLRREHTGEFEADLTPDRLLLRLTTEDDPDWDEEVCSDIAQPHPHEIAVAFTEAPVPERVEVCHGDETVLDEAV